MVSKTGKRIYKIGIQILTCLILVLLVYYIYIHYEEFIRLKELPFRTIILAVLFSIGSILSGYVFIKIAMEVLGVKLTVTEWVGIPAVSNLIGIFTPMRADLIFKGVYYKHKCGVSYSRYLSFTIGGSIIAVLVYIADFIISIFLGKLKNAEELVMTILFATILLVICILGLVVLKCSKQWVLKYLPLKKYTVPIVNAFYEVLYSKKVLVSCIITILISNFFGVLTLWVIAKALTPDVQLFQTILYYIVYQFASLLTVIPGNIGITESLVGIVGASTGALFEHGMMVSLMTRLVAIVAYLLLSIIFAIPVVKKMRNHSEFEG